MCIRSRTCYEAPKVRNAWVRGDKENQAGRALKENVLSFARCRMQNQTSVVISRRLGDKLPQRASGKQRPPLALLNLWRFTLLQELIVGHTSHKVGRAMRCRTPHHSLRCGLLPCCVYSCTSPRLMLSARMSPPSSLAFAFLIVASPTPSLPCRPIAKRPRWALLASSGGPMCETNTAVRSRSV